MTTIKTTAHPTESELAGFLDNSLQGPDRLKIEAHLAECGECLDAIAAAHEAVRQFGGSRKKWRRHIMKRINIYLVLAAVSFTLSFITPRYFIQLLVATLILGIKWVVDSKATRMLVMIHEAWKKGGGVEASRILERLDTKNKNRL